MTTTILLQPLDTFFFRDGKPFSRGEQTQATALFPPFPSTVYGALRSLYISEHGWEAFEAGDFEHEIGTPLSDDISSFRVQGIFVENEEQDEEYSIYAPLPCDLVAEKKDMKEAEGKELSEPTPYDAYPLSLAPHAIVSNSPVPSLLINQLNADITVEYPSQGAFISHTHLKQYLQGRQERLELYLAENFFLHEPKVGIARDVNTRTTRDACLYTLPMLRFKQYPRDESGHNRLKSYHLRVDVSGMTFAHTQGILKLGGEHKAFEYQVSQSNPVLEYSETEWQALLQAIAQTRRFKLYCATPVIWDAGSPDQEQIPGWKASWMDGKTPIATPDGKTSVTCELLTAAIGRYQTAGGWDIVKGRPKTMQRAVPAGSVYYLKLTNDSKPEDVLKVFHNQNISQHRAKEGFGLTYVGVIPGGTP